MLCAISVLATGCAAASCSAKLPPVAGKEEEKPAQTGSILNPPSPEGTGLPPASDLAYAKVAATEVVGLERQDASVPWENPSSGARGMVTPLTTAYRIDGEVCRDFLASYVAEGTESWFQGEACRENTGKWEVRRMKAWRRS
jgi:hypothetical protein